MVKYEQVPLSPLTSHRLCEFSYQYWVYQVFSVVVRRKILVLDLDETLIHSHHDGIVRTMVKPGTPSDFTIKVGGCKCMLILVMFQVTIDRHPVRFSVHARPHVDYFLSVVSQWLVILPICRTYCFI